MEILNVILKSAEESFLQVSVFVGATLILFGYLDYKLNGRLIDYISKNKKIQPIIGAILGLTPGCGGAILLMPLYIKKSVSFGTVIATLIATMGDAAFVLLSTDIIAYFWISIISFVVAIISGYVVDAMKIEKRLNLKKNIEVDRSYDGIEVMTDYELGINASNHGVGKHIGHSENDEIDYVLHHKDRKSTSQAQYNFVHGIGYKLYLLFISIGLILGIMLLFQVDVNEDLGIKGIGSIIGIIGTTISIVYMVISKKFLKNNEHEIEESKNFSIKETIIHNAYETAFVATWVFVAYLAYEVAVMLIGGEEVIKSALLSAGLMSVIVGALIGLIPGCGPQILFVTLFTKGMIPFSALIANAISQDGDALFPMIAMDRKSSLWLTVITTIPALIVGLLFFALENYLKLNQ